MTVVRQQVKSQAGASSEPEMLKALTSMFKSHKTDEETVCVATAVLDLCTCCV